MQQTELHFCGYVRRNTRDRSKELGDSDLDWAAVVAVVRPDLNEQVVKIKSLFRLMGRS